MTIPELVRRRIHKQLVDFCIAVVPEKCADKERLNFRIRHNRVSVFYETPAWTEPGLRKELLGQFRYYGQTGTWLCYYMLNERKWHLMETVPPTQSFGEFLKQVQPNFRGVHACRAMKTITEEFCKFFDLGLPEEF